MKSIGSYIRAHHVGLLALFVALGGTAAATSNALLPRNSVRSAQVVDHSLVKLDLSRKTVKALKGNRGLRGLRGATGAQGAAGVGPGFIATSTLPAAVPASATTTIQTLNVPAGSYLIFARADVNSNAAAP